jgi:hypothetical protein
MAQPNQEAPAYRVLKKVDVERTMTWLLSMQPTVRIADLLRHMALLNFNTTDKRAFKQFARQYAQERELVGSRDVGPEMITEFYRVDTPKHVFSPDSVVRSIVEESAPAKAPHRSEQLAVPDTRPVLLGPRRSVYLQELAVLKGRFDLEELLAKYPEDCLLVTTVNRRDMDGMVFEPGTDYSKARNYYAVEMGVRKDDVRNALLRNMRRVLTRNAQNAAQ